MAYQKRETLEVVVPNDEHSILYADSIQKLLKDYKGVIVEAINDDVVKIWDVPIGKARHEIIQVLRGVGVIFTDEFAA